MSSSQHTSPPQPLNIDHAFQKALQHHQHNDLVTAERLYKAILHTQPRHADALHLLGVIQHQSRHPEAALAYINQALAIQPDYPAALSNKGLVLQRLMRLEEAVVCYNQALALMPDFAGARYNRANALKDLLQFDKACVDYKQVLALQTDTDYCFGTLLHCQSSMCDWREYDQIAELVRQVKAGQRASTPFPLLSLTDDADAQRLCAQSYALDKHPVHTSPLWQGEQYQHSKIRIAYVSADFREHALSYLLVGALEKHDRQRFEIIGLSLKKDDKTAMGQRVRQAFDQFIDVSQQSDDDIARLLRKLEIDIAVDLMGFTQDSRPNIFARRPAPIQINYLGYPSTMSVPYMDYIIGDHFVTPEAHQRYCSEKIIYLPDCFQANDDKRVIANTITSRQELNLPETAFVFCSFNNSYKLNPQFVDCWIRLLTQVPNSVLWLLSGIPLVENNLRAYIADHGINPDRLIFAPRIGYAEHLARLQFADLFLDSLPFNAGTTASDALWAGLPVLTCAGQSFAGRMAGSLLSALDLPELITHSLADYEQRALQLATRHNTLSRLRAKLQHAKTHAPLFNTARFCRHLESAYTAIYARYQQGLSPEHIHVSAITP